MDDADIRAEVEALDRRLEDLEQLPDGDARTAAVAAVEGLLYVYGEALRRIAERVGGAALTGDELLDHLLFLHGLHPATLEERIAAALDEVRPYMGSHGGGIELVEVAGGVARVRLRGTCSGCAASTMTLKLAVEEAVLRAAPELEAVEAVEAEEADAPEAGPVPQSLLLPMVQAPGRWTAAGTVAQLSASGAPLRRDVAGMRMLFVDLDDELYAYADRCPGCGDALADPLVVDGALVCGGCGRRFDVRRAGQCLDGGLLQLDPVPLLVGDSGQVRVAVEAAPA